MWSSPTQRFVRILLPALVVGGILFEWRRAEPAPEPVRRLSRGEVEVRDNLVCGRGESVPFSGVLVADYSPGHRKLEVEIQRGRPHGVSRGWFENGQLEVEERFVRGIAQGRRTRWFPDGSKKSETSIAGGVVTGVFREWYTTGKLATEVPMVN